MSHTVDGRKEGAKDWQSILLMSILRIWRNSLRWITNHMWWYSNIYCMSLPVMQWDLWINQYMRYTSREGCLSLSLSSPIHLISYSPHDGFAPSNQDLTLTATVTCSGYRYVLICTQNTHRNLSVWLPPSPSLTHTHTHTENTHGVPLTVSLSWGWRDLLDGCIQEKT